MRHLSYSQLSDWMTCHFRWYLKNIEKLQPKEQQGPLSLGTAVHLGLESAILGCDDSGITSTIERWLRDMVELYGPEDDRFMDDDIRFVLSEIAEKAVNLTRRAVKFLGLREGRWTTLEIDGQPLVEFEIQTTLDNGQPFVGRVDWVARDNETGRSWLIDHKTRKRFSDDSAEDFDLQKAIYQYVLWKEYGLETTGSMTFEILNHVPAIPDVNKDGSISRRAITTDWETYRGVVLANGGLENDYLDMMLKLREVEFFRLTKSFRDIAFVGQIWDEIVHPLAYEMNYISLHPSPTDNPAVQYVRSMSPWNCKYCPVQTSCMARLAGYDVESIEKMEYTRGD